MSDRQSLISISTGADDDEYNKVFTQLSFYLKQGRSEIRIYEVIGTLCYIDSDGEALRKLEFDEKTISLTYSSFNKAMKQILDLDRQRANKINVNNTLDRIEDNSNSYLEPVSSSLDEIRKILPEAN